MTDSRSCENIQDNSRGKKFHNFKIVSQMNVACRQISNQLLFNCFVCVFSETLIEWTAQFPLANWVK